MKWPYVALVLVAATLASAVGDEAPSLDIASEPTPAPSPDPVSTLGELKREQDDFRDTLLEMKEIADRLAGRLNVQPPKGKAAD